VNFATRPSALARWQTQWVIVSLEKAWPGLTCRQTVITTKGDRVLDRPLPEIGGKGLFTQELEMALLEKQVDAAVHSLKDLPVDDEPGLTLAAVTARAEVRDALISRDGLTLDELPEGARVGTSSLRRAAQLRAYRRDLQPEPVRGNVDTRLRKALEGQYDAVVLAGAGLERLGLLMHVSQWLPLDIMLPAPGQGALAVQARASDESSLNYLAAVEDPRSRKATMAERAFLAGLGGGCSLPVAAHAQVETDRIYLTGLVASPHGDNVIRLAAEGQDPVWLGQELARQAMESGAEELLGALNRP
jgi:hydroxymethylbilane synthase